MKRIAWFVPGGVAAASSVMHIPILTQIAEKLSAHCELIVYSLTSDDSKVVEMKPNRLVVKYLPIRWNDAWSRRVVGFISRFLLDHRRVHFDLVHALWGSPSGVAAVVAGKIARIPSVVSFLGSESASIPELGYGLLRTGRGKWLVRWLGHQASCVHLLTKFQAQQLRARGISLRRTSVIPFGTNTTMFAPQTDGLFPMRPPYRFLHVANLTEVKDQTTLLRAFRIIVSRVPATLRIVGPDYLHGALPSLARELNVSSSVEFIGSVNHETMSSHYGWAHMLLHTSVHEAQSMVVVEALAAGLPVVGTDVGLLHDLRDECLLTVSPGDAEGLAERALALLHSPTQIQALRLRGRMWAEAHSLNHTVDQLLELYDGVHSRDR